MFVEVRVFSRAPSYADLAKGNSADGVRQGKAEIIKNPSLAEGRILIVDDLVDTGGTAQIVRKAYPKAHIATVYAKPKGRKTADTYQKDLTQETWVVFSWENYDVPA